MNGKKAGQRHLLALAGASTVMAFFAGCGPRANDINTVQPGYVKKAIFQQDSEWYYRRTIAKSETTNQYIIEGHGDIQLDRIRWRIEENLLIAYKPYEAVPGAQTEEYEGSLGFEGTILAEFPISYHFDIKRDYDPQTGNELNTVGENTTDRVWTEREYMRVDWSTNLVEGSMHADYSGYWFPVNFVSTGSYWTDLDTSPTDEFASRFTNDYVEVTHAVILGMDIYMCAAFAGYSYAGYGNCGFGEAKVRHSFTRINERSDYIPRDYPDSYVRKDADGRSITDPDTGEVLREPIYDRFGIFRTETPTYDRGYGTTESGRLFRALIFNIWERHTDDNGNEIPMAQRTPKPIIYYLNADYPERWRKAAREVAAEYDRVYTNMVRDIVADDSKVPAHMFEIRDNDCNVANVKAFVSNNPDYTFAVARAVCSDGKACDNPLEMVKFGNLTQVCTSLEAATRDAETGLPAFNWQRIGDNRYNMVVWLNNPQMSPWGGYGPMHADARTGESVSATSFLRGFGYEVAASQIVDYIELINDEKTITDVIYGQDIRKTATASAEKYKEITRNRNSAAFTNMIENRMALLGSNRAELLREIDTNHQAKRMERAEGTSIEEHMITDLDLYMAAEGQFNPNRDLPTEEMMKMASPLGRITQTNPYAAAKQKARQALSRAGYCFLNYDFDIHWAGLALALQGLSREERYQIVAEKLIKHVMLHELGHNVGMAHNFEGSYDALNYGRNYWDWHWATDEEQVASRSNEFRNSTVMEYIGQGKGAFSDYLGLYDEAAIRFAYGHQVAVFNSPVVDPALEGGNRLREWRYMNDYTKIPDHLCGGGCANEQDAIDAIHNRSWVPFDPQSPPANEVPFLFCDNTYDRMTPFCSTFDYGSNLREIFANYYTNWQNYFFFNNFLRDRLSPLAWSPSRAINPLVSTLLFVDTVGQYLYYMQANSPSFAQTDLGQDMLTTVASGLNMASEVISTPTPDRMCPWPGLSNPQVYIPWYYLNDCDQYAELNSQYSIDAQAIQLPLGPARPSTLGFTDDYIDWDWSFVGSYWDKSNVLWLLGYNRPRFFRFNYDLDQRNYDISLFRLFEPELRAFYDHLIVVDGYFITAETGQNLGSYWCRNETDPNVAYLGHFEPRRLIDPTSATNPSLPGPSASCTNPATIYPSLLRNMPFSAMYYAHALFSSDFDSELDMGKAMKIYAYGAFDDYPSWDLLPADEICSCVDIQTGVDYRAIHQPAGIPDVGCRVVERACDAQNDFLGSNNNPGYRDRWRAWMERLEYARDLTRMFDSASVRVRY